MPLIKAFFIRTIFSWTVAWHIDTDRTSQ